MTKLSIQSDEYLLTLLRAGDDYAFKTLYDKYWDKLYCVAAGRLKDSYEAEGVVQDIFTRLWRNREKLIIETEFDRYLAGAVKLEVINRLAKKARISERVEQVTRSMYALTDHDIHDRIDLKDLLRDIDQTIRSLPTQCRIVFTLSRKEHCSHKAIAEKLQISEKTVQKHITIALKALKGKYAIAGYLVFLFSLLQE